LDDILDAFRAVGDPSRLRILCLLKSAELTVSELVSILGQSQPRVSRHLKGLVDAGLLSRFREGSRVFHRLNLQGYARQLVDLIEPNDPVCVQDLAHLGEVERIRNEVAERYFAKYAPEWDRLRQLDVDEDQVADAVREMLPLTQSERLLDLGTGTGRMLKNLGPDVLEAVGIDSSHEMLAVARSNISRWGLKNCSLRQADLLALPLPIGTFDVVVLHQVLHFLKRPWAALSEARRMLNDGGRMLIVDLAPHDLEDLRDQHAHYRLGFTDIEVREWLADQGLACETIRHLPGGQGSDGLTVTIWLAKTVGPKVIM